MWCRVSDSRLSPTLPFPRLFLFCLQSLVEFLRRFNICYYHNQFVVKMSCVLFRKKHIRSLSKILCQMIWTSLGGGGHVLQTHGHITMEHGWEPDNRLTIPLAQFYWVKWNVQKTCSVLECQSYSFVKTKPSRFVIILKPMTTTSTTSAPQPARSIDQQHNHSKKYTIIVWTRTRIYKLIVNRTIKMNKIVQIMHEHMYFVKRLCTCAHRFT